MLTKALSVVTICSLIIVSQPGYSQSYLADRSTAADHFAIADYMVISQLNVPNYYRAYTLQTIKKPPSQKRIVVDPNSHTWRAYSESGKLLRSGMATAGSRWCPDIGRPCKTKAGTFYIYSLGSSGCKSKKYPLPRGGAPMPYCMFFNGGQGLHGSYQVVAGNVSHGCVRLHVKDAKWIRFNFAGVGTKVIIKSY